MLIAGGTVPTRDARRAGVGMPPASSRRAIAAAGAARGRDGRGARRPRRASTSRSTRSSAERCAARAAVPVGPEPVIAYVLAREAEVAALRVLLLGKLAGLDRETLRARLRERTRRRRTMPRVAIVGDAVSVAGFRPLGLRDVRGRAAGGRARRSGRELAGGEYAVVFVTEPVYEAIADLVAETADSRCPR